MTRRSLLSIEFSLPTILLSVALTVVMAAANVYLGLKAGMTVAASIPSAVIAMGLFRGVFRREHSVLEANMVQTAASTGEALAAGVIFTMPALVLAQVWTTFDFWTTSLIALTGGVLGVLFMIPMRKVFVIGSPELKFPEGVACAQVLRASEGGSSAQAAGKAKLLYQSAILGGLFKFVSSFLGLFLSTIEYAKYVGNRVFLVGSDISPALIGVGFIVELEVAVQVFLGGLIGWCIALPSIEIADITAMPAMDMAWSLARSKSRYLGVGAMITGGVISIIKVRHSLVQAVREMKKVFAKGEDAKNVPETEQDMSSKWILVLSVATILTVGMLYYHLLNNLPITILTTIIMVVMSFFLTAVASYIVGLVGNSNSPVSGMTISAVLLTGVLLYLFGFEGRDGVIAVLGVAGVVCCVCCTAGDTCNDLKAGHILGSSPRNQQWMEIVGVVSSAFIMAPLLVVMHEGSIKNGTGGIGGKEFSAPQAKLFSSLAQGFFGGEALPWNWIIAGAVLGVLIFTVDALLKRAGTKTRLHVMPVAIGIYLPVGISLPMLVGGLINHALQSKKKDTEPGVLASSGVIAGESIVGVILAVLAYFNLTSLNWGEKVGEHGLMALSAVGIVAFCAWFYRQANRAS